MTRNLAHAPSNLLLSMASAWELAVKSSLSKLTLALPYEDFLVQHLQINDIQLLPIQLSHVLHTSKMPFHHKDPFDRLIIAQSIIEEILVLSVDTIFDMYGVVRVW